MPTATCARIRGWRSAPPLPEVKVSDAHLAERREPPRVEATLPPLREVYEALVLGTRDYVVKNEFTDVIIGLSGGIGITLRIAEYTVTPEQA